MGYPSNLVPKQETPDPHWLDLSWRGLYLLLPYLPTVSVVLLVLLTGWGGWRQRLSLGQQWQTWGLLGLAGLLVLNCGISAYPAESLLQLVNYLPFFAGYLVLASVWASVERGRQATIDLVLTALPINLIAVVEFGLKVGRLAAPGLAAQLQIAGWPSGEEPNRAVAIFNHPNFLASYMVLVLGLGLGLLVGIKRQKLTLQPWLGRLVGLATGLCFVGIFCSGSRNALAVAVLQVLVAGSLLKLSRRLWLAGWLGLGGLGAILLGFGLGGRQISLEVFRNDPRLGLWQIAAGLIQERPWLGWGLGSFKFLYPSRLIDPTYPEIAHPHNFGLMMGAEAGLPILLVFVGIVGTIRYQGVRFYQKTQWSEPAKTVLLAYLLALLGSFTYALFDTSLFDARINLLNWTGLAVLTGLARQQRHQETLKY